MNFNDHANDELPVMTDMIKIFFSNVKLFKIYFYLLEMIKLQYNSRITYIFACI